MHLSSSYNEKNLVSAFGKLFVVEYIYVLLLVLVPLPLLKAKRAISSPSDLSSDNSDLAMLKSLLAGLSLPSKSGILDRGSDEEKDGESDWEEELFQLVNLQDVLEHRYFMGCMPCLFS